MRGHRSGQTGANKVEIIKAIRAVSGLGLYEAKQVADSLLAGQEQRIQSESFELRDLNVKKLWAVGINAV
jgi:ribosomal protein L7/L12